MSHLQVSEFPEYCTSLTYINMRDCNGQTLQHRACMGSHLSLVREQLEQSHCDVYARDKNNQSAVDIALEKDNWALCECQTVSCSSISSTLDENGYNQLQKAVLEGSLEITRGLLKRNLFDVSLRTRSGETLQHLACRSNNVPQVRCVLEHYLDVNAVDSYGRSPIHPIVTQEGPLCFIPYLPSAAIVDLLREHGFTAVNRVDQHGFAALHYAAALNSVDLVAALLRHPAIDVNARDRSGNGVIHGNMFGDYSMSCSVMKLLLNHPTMDTSTPNLQGHVALEYALCGRDLALCWMLVEHEVKSSHYSRILHILTGTSSTTFTPDDIATLLEHALSYKAKYY